VAGAGLGRDRAEAARLVVLQSPDGLVWHIHCRLDRTLEMVRWEAQTVGRLLGTRTAALLCVHGAHGGGLHAKGVAIVPTHLLRSALGDDRVLSGADVALLAATARTSLRPAV
jgi:predicted DCC family thiol-disulfide oxidoreductase YuxK